MTTQRTSGSGSVRFVFSFFAAAFCLGSVPLLSAADAPNPEQLDFFEKKIRPVLAEHCYRCHSQEHKVRGGLALDTRDAMRKGGDSGPAVVPGNLSASLLLEAMKYESFEMPPDRKLPPQVVADFEQWVKLGAADPRDEPKGKIAAVPASQIDLDEGRKFWAFQPPQAHPAPAVQQADWPKGKIDAFILKGLESAGLSPAEPASRAVWLRRVTFDLVGLPPTPEELEAFVHDSAPGSEERVVERLLASPHFGERWARVWLDLARYAEDQAHIVGNDTSLCYPNAYLYRDWVVAALNADMPYDEFVRRQLAADLIAPQDEAGLAALGFMGLGPKYYSRGNLEVMADEWEDRVDVLSRGLLGLTTACARCHDHKFDPIPTADYYSLAGVFASTAMYNRPFPEVAAAEREAAAKREAEEKAQAAAEAEAAAKLPPPKDDAEAKAREAAAKEKRKAADKMRQEQARIGRDGQAKKPEDSVHILQEGKPADLPIFIRGDVKNKGPQAPRRFLQVLSRSAPQPFVKEGEPQRSGRRELAEAIVSKENPLAARVLVNRVWGQLFGRGIVGTQSNFGRMGDRPSHPELLDDLAVRFMENGWSIKRLVKELVLSATYAQSSVPPSATLAADPENRLLGRASRRRLTVEQWRDSLLAATGRLDERVGGTSIDPASPTETRRTLYSRISRLELAKMLALFDFPDPNTHSDRRVETTTPLQKMFVLNNPFMTAQAEAFAARLLGPVPPVGPPCVVRPAPAAAKKPAEFAAADSVDALLPLEPAADSAETPAIEEDSERLRIAAAYKILFAREPVSAETELGLAYLRSAEGTRRQRWVQYAQVLLASNETLFLD